MQQRTPSALSSICFNVMHCMQTGPPLSLTKGQLTQNSKTQVGSSTKSLHNGVKLLKQIYNVCTCSPALSHGRVSQKCMAQSILRTILYNFRTPHHVARLQICAGIYSTGAQVPNGAQPNLAFSEQLFGCTACVPVTT